VNVVRHAIFLGKSSFRVAAVEGDFVCWSKTAFANDATPESEAKLIAGALRELNYRGDPALLALPTISCLSAPVSLKGAGARDRKALVFRLEEQLPIAAEDFVADFIATADEALGVAVVTNPLKALVDALATESVAIAHVVPAAFLDAAGRAPAAGIALSREDDVVSIVEQRDGRPRRWMLARCDTESIRDTLDAGGIDANHQIDSAAIGEAGDAAARRAANILAGSIRPTIDLRRDALEPADGRAGIRGALNAFLAAVAVFVLALASAWMILAHRNNQVAAHNDAQLVAAFHDVFPGWDPINISDIVHSEHQKLSAIHSADLPPEARGSALAMLREIIVSLPEDKGLVVDRMTFDDSAFELSGSVDSLETVESIAQATRVDGLEVGPPQTHRDERGRWAFELRGSRPSTAVSARLEDR
jgi:hypothetical protein